MGDDEASAIFHEFLEGVLDKAFRFGIKGRSSFVENKYRGVFENGARNGNALTLATGKFGAAFASEGIVAFGKINDEVVGVGKLGGMDNFVFGGVGFAVGDVFGKGAMEKNSILGDIGDVLAQARLSNRGNILAINENIAGVDV